MRIQAECQRLCLRQNQISRIQIPENIAATLSELDLYDNGIRHISGLELMTNLTSLDLSFNEIKHIRSLDALVNVRDLYLLQNSISRIEGLEKLTQVTNLELGANRIRVRQTSIVFG